MSNRHVKKVFGSGTDVLLIDPASEDENPVSFSTPRRVVKNPYELLNEVSESDAKEDDGQAEDEDCNKSADSSKMDDDTQSTKKKKKKKKAGRNKKKSVNVPDSEATEDESVVRAKSKPKQPSVPGQTQGKANSVTEFLGARGHEDFAKLFDLDPRFLHQEFELRKIFGSKVLNMDRGKRSQRVVHRHKNLLVTPKESWPSTTLSGLSMQFLYQKDCFSYFKFTHNTDYQDTQRTFIQAVDSLQPENVMAIMKSHPYHIDSHIQMSDMAKQAEDMQVATELIEMGLYGMESAFHTDFVLNLPINRLEYKYQENRGFFILLFKHLTYVGQRACYRTAFELCKRLLILDPENDPLCALLMLDFYALKSGEYSWLIDLTNHWEPTKNLSQLPNYAYSLALAQYLLYLESSKEDKTKSKKSDQYHQFGLNRLKPKVELDESAQNELIKNSSARLQYAILMFPAMVRPLIEKCNLHVDSKLVNNPFFNAPSLNSESRGLKLLCELYVWRTHHVWRDPRLASWLEKNITAALECVSRGDPRVAEFESKRKVRYQGTPRNVIRHVILTDNKELTINLPSDLSKEPILNYDPLPPTDSINIYSHKQAPPPSNERLSIFSFLNSFFYEMGGNNHQLGAEVMEAIQGAEAQPPIAVGAGIHQSVTGLLDAMRALLSVQVPNNGDDEGNNGEAADDGDESEGET